MKQIRVDFQGWPINAITLKEFLQTLGLEIKQLEGKYDLIDGYIDRRLLNSYLKVLDDDGMAYGVNPRYITEVDSAIYNDEELDENVFNIFTDPIVK